MLDQSGQDFGQRATRFTGCDEVNVNWREDAGEITKRLGKTAPVDERLVQAVRHLLEARLLEALFQDGKTFVEGHSGPQEMGELLGKDEQLAVGEFQFLRRRC